MGRKILRIILWIVGIILVLVLLFVGYITIWAINNVKVDPNAAISDGTSSPSFSQTIDLTLLHAALKRYHDRTEGMYPATLAELVPGDLSRIPTDADGRPYQYRATENGRGYELCNKNEDGSQRCLGKDSSGNSI